MKIKKYLLIIFLFVVGLIILPSFVKRLFPSSEMKDLRLIEASIQTPKTWQRREDDKGCYQDWKGAQQYGRDIYQAFKDINTINKIKLNIENDGWVLKNKYVSDYDYHRESYIYWKESEKNKQISISIKSGISEKDNMYPHTMFISDTNDEQCFMR